jgi:hypothetical protein
VETKAIVLSPFKCFAFALYSGAEENTPTVTLLEGVKLAAPTAVAVEIVAATYEVAYASPAAMVRAITKQIFIIVGLAIC